MKRVRLAEPLFAFRIAGAHYPTLSADGSALYPGRWNRRGVKVLYACLTYEGALLEQLAHLGPVPVPKDRVWTRLAIPAGLEIDEFADDIPDWFDHADDTMNLGATWANEGQTVALIVPGYVARPWQRNVIFNPRHDDFPRLSSTPPELVGWDHRLVR